MNFHREICKETSVKFGYAKVGNEMLGQFSINNYLINVI